MPNKVRFKSAIKRAVVFILIASMMLITAGCSSDSFYALFEDGADSGTYFVIYDKDSTDDEIAAIPDTHLTRYDFREGIKKYELSYEVTVTKDEETENEAILTCYYYHDRDNEDADDYCKIGISLSGTYEQSEDGTTLTFHTEKEDGYNLYFYSVGADYAGNEDFSRFSLADDKSCGIWAYAHATWDYESEAVIDERVVEDIPDTITFTLDGNKIVTWE